MRNLAHFLPWVERYAAEGDETRYRHNLYLIHDFHPDDFHMTPVQQRAWIKYYESMRDDPEATEEERQRAISMLKKGQLLDIKDIRPEDLA